jgi:hypothetical protein
MEVESVFFGNLILNINEAIALSHHSMAANSKSRSRSPTMNRRGQPSFMTAGMMKSSGLRSKKAAGCQHIRRVVLAHEWLHWFLIKVSWPV